MNLPAEVKDLMTEDLIRAFDEIQMARSPYILKHFVVGQHDTIEQQYAQCVLELQIKYDVIRRAILGREKLKIEQAKIERAASLIAEPDDKRIKEIEGQMKGLDVEEQDRAMKGALREFAALYEIFKTFKNQYTRDDLNKAQPDYWQKRLTRQANQDMLAFGRIQVGNADALRMAGMSPVPALDHIRSVDQKYLEIADCKIMIVVPTEKKAVNGLPCVDGLVIPTGAQVKYLNVFGRKIDDAYNYAATELLKDGANFMLCVEDDTFPPADALVKLLDYCRKNPKTIWGAWYPKRSEVYEGAPIIISADGKRTHLDADGQVHECYTLPQGCALIPAEVFLQTTYPYFVTTEHLTQDSFFSQLARDAGWKLLCDTGIRCRHVDRVTGKVYEKPLGDPPGGRKTILNIGCGMKGENALPAEYQTPPWREIRIDIDPNVQPDIVADMTHLGQVKADAIWSSHQLEHLAAHEVMVALEECRRVLNPGGMLHLEVPNLQAVCEAVARGTIEVDKPLYQSPAGPIAPLDILYGHRASIAEGRSYMTHRTGFTVQTLEKALSDVGFRDISVFGDGLVIHACAYKQGHLSEIRKEGGASSVA